MSDSESASEWNAGSSKLEQDGENKAPSSISETAAYESYTGSSGHTAAVGAEKIEAEDVSRPAERRTQADYDEFTAIKRDLRQEWSAEGLLENEEINRLARCILRGRRTNAIYDSQIDHALTRLEHYQRVRLRTQQRAFMNQLFTTNEREPGDNGER